MEIPEIITESEIDDIYGIELDVESLYEKFIKPIDDIRSYSVPTMTNRPVVIDSGNVSNDIANSSDVNPSVFQESRCHAFFRMIGLPIVSKDGEFYSPGFDPTLKSDQRKKNYDISAKVSNSVKNLSFQREFQARNRLSIYSKYTYRNCLYNLCISCPVGTKPFLQMNTDEAFDFNQSEDEQKFNIPERVNYITFRYSLQDGSLITPGLLNDFSSGTHILRPFVVDPNIDDVVTGKSGETRRVAALFLKKKDTAIENSIYTKRAGLELILRLRLKSQSISNQDVETVLKSVSTSNEFSDSLQSVFAILDKEEIDKSDILNALKFSSTYLELSNINTLVKTLKGIIDIFARSINTIESSSKTIKFTPISLELGPEAGSETTNLINQNIKTELEKRLLSLNVRAAINKRIGSLSDDQSIVYSDFHMSQFLNTDKPWTTEISNVTEEINDYEREAFRSLSLIELITGEISGLGLVDIIAIYISLWVVDIRVLLGLIDDVAFERLYSNADLRVKAVEDRYNFGQEISVTDSLKTLEKQIINILSYSDRLYKQKLGSPIDEEGGNISVI